MLNKSFIIKLVNKVLKSDNPAYLIHFIRRNNFKTKQINKIVGIILNNFSPKEVFKLSKLLLNENGGISKDLVCDLIWVCYPQHKNYVLRALLKLANDEDWGVRESAAWLVYHLLKNYYEDFKPFLKKMIRSKHANVRRTAAVGIMRFAKHRIPKYGKELLRMIEPLLYDKNNYVKRNLGPFVIGDGFLRYYPEETISWLQKWMKNEDEQVRWNIAKVFSTAEAIKHKNAALKILRYLARDKRKRVRSAVMSSMRNLKNKER